MSNSAVIEFTETVFSVEVFTLGLTECLDVLYSTFSVLHSVEISDIIPINCVVQGNGKLNQAK